MKIYTKTGDKGKTSLFDGTKVAKFDVRIEAYGTLDELNSLLGYTLSFLSGKKYHSITSELEEIQHDIYAMSSALALPYMIPVVGLNQRVLSLEEIIDKLTKQLPLLTQFIIPVGGKGGALLHVARTVSRRAERRIVALHDTQPVDESIIMYINRLSDLLFTMARFVNMVDKKKEVHWKKR